MVAGFRAPNSFKMRLAGGAWCIAALILTNYYSSILTSLITVSNSPVPIANSVEDVANNDDIELVVLKVHMSGTAGFIAVCFLHFILYINLHIIILIRRRVHISTYPNRVS